jgi:hypothetical protein
MAGINPINPNGSSVRMSTNLSIDRQTPKTDFGNRVKSGMDTAANAVATGAAVAAPFVPGGAIVSAAVSSVGTMSAASGSQGGVATQYSGFSSMPSPTGGSAPGGLSTTVPGGAGGGGSLPAVGSTTGGGAPSLVPNAGAGGTMGGFNADLESMRRTNLELMQAQMSMQRENQVFTTVSNVLKVRHDTVKNTIQNVR